MTSANTEIEQITLKVDPAKMCNEAINDFKSVVEEDLKKKGVTLRGLLYIEKTPKKYHCIKIKTYPENQPVERIFYNVTDLQETIKIENAPAFNVNSFYFIDKDARRYFMAGIHGEVIEKVELAE